MNKAPAVLGNLKKGLVFVVSAPAGTGKTTLVELLVQEFGSVVASVSYTTRKKRNGEIDGVHYNFISKEEFLAKVDEGDFLEYAEIYGEYYGTSRSWVEKKIQKGKHVVLVIDTQGARAVKTHISASFIFILPPSLEDLKQRLYSRNTETLEAIEKRMLSASKEIEEGLKEYEYLIVNQEVAVAYQILKSIVIAEEHRAKHYRYKEKLCH